MAWSIYSADRLSDYAAAWDQLNEQSFRTTLLDTDFLIPALEIFGTGDELLVIYKQGEDIQAMAIATRDGIASWRTFQPSQAPLGAWLLHPDSPTTDLARQLMDELPGFGVLLSVTQQDPDITLPPEHVGRIRSIDYIDTGRIVTIGSFEDYWRERSKNLRHNIKRQCNRLEREGIQLHWDCLTRTDDIAAGVADYGRLESAGWKSETGTAIHPDNDQGRFYKRMLERFSNKGQGRIYRYFYNDLLAAVDLCITGFGDLIVLKTTYDESIKTSSPAMLMLQQITQECFADPGIQRLEFYGRARDWHTKWSSEIRTMYHMNCYRWSFLAQMQAAAKNLRLTLITSFKEAS